MKPTFKCLIKPYMFDNRQLPSYIQQIV